MRKHLPLLLILVAIGLGYGLFAGSEDDELPAFDAHLENDAVVPPPLKEVHLDTAKGAEAAAERAKRPKKAWQAPDPRTLPTGVLIVKPTGPDLKPLMLPRLQILVTPRGQRVTKQGLYDSATGYWRFERIIAGPVDVRVKSDHIVSRTLETPVRADRESELVLHLEVAGAVKYDVITYAKTRPAKVLLELFDWQNRPSVGWFQERAARRLTTPKEAKRMTIGPEGIVFGLRPGRYRLKATNLESDEWDEAELHVKAGTTAPVTLEVRR